MAPSLPASGNVIIVKKSGEDGSKFPVVGGSIAIGRGSECDIKILLKDVSIVQCTISTYKNFATITNISEEFATIVNNEAIDSKVLQHCDIITLSNRNFRWEYIRPNAVRTRIPVKSIANKKKMPSFPASLLNKRKSPNVVGSRRSEILPKKVDSQIKKLIESKGRLSLSDLPVKTRQSVTTLQMNLMLTSPEEKVRKIAVVKPQRRSAEVDTTNTPNASGPAGDNVLHVQVKPDRRSSVTKMRLVTKPHRGQSLSPLKSYTGKSKAKKRESLPADIVKLRAVRRTPQAAARSISKRVSLKNQTEFIGAAIRAVENIEKVVEPTSIDEHKKAALMLLTGRSPVKKTMVPIIVGAKSTQKKTIGKVLMKNTPKPVAHKAYAPKSVQKSVQRTVRPIIDTPRPKNVLLPSSLVKSSVKRVTSVVKNTPNVIKSTPSITRSTPTVRSSVKRSAVQVGIKKSPKKGLFQTPSSRAAASKAGKSETKLPGSAVNSVIGGAENEPKIAAKLKTSTHSSKILSVFEESTSKDLKSALKSPDSKRRSDKIKFDLSNLEESSPDKRKSTRVQSSSLTPSKSSSVPKTPQARKSVHSTPHPNTGQRVNYIRKRGDEFSLPLFNLSDSEYDLESLSDIEPAEMVAKNSTFSINKSSSSSLYNTAVSGRVSRSNKSTLLGTPSSSSQKGRHSSAASQKRCTTGNISPSSKLRRVSLSPVSKSYGISSAYKTQAVLMLSSNDFKDSPVPSKLKGGRVSKTPKLARVIDDSLSAIGSSLEESGINFLPSPKTTPNTSAKTRKTKLSSAKKTQIRKSFRSPKLSLGDLFDVLKTPIESKANIKSNSRQGNLSGRKSQKLTNSTLISPRDARTSRSSSNYSVSDVITYTPNKTQSVGITAQGDSSNVSKITLSSTLSGRKSQKFESNSVVSPRASRSTPNFSVLGHFDSSSQNNSPGNKSNASVSTQLQNKSQSDTSNHSLSDLSKSSKLPKLTLSIIHSRTPPSKILSSPDDDVNLSTVSRAGVSQSIGSSKDVTTPANVRRTDSSKGSRHLRSANDFEISAALSESPSLLMSAGRTPRPEKSFRQRSTQSPLQIMNFEDAQITTPSISILFEPKSSTPKPNRPSYQKTIKHFEFLPTPEVTSPYKKFERKTIGGGVPKRKSRLIENLVAPQSESKAYRGGVQKASLKRSQGSVNLNVVKTVMNTSRHSNRSSDLSSNVSNVTDVTAPKPNNEVIITPKSTLKLLPELVKEKHSTAKKNRISRKSFIDHINESKDIVKQLFTIPVKRKLSQSIGHFDTSDLVDEEELNFSIASINQSTDERVSRLGRSTNSSLNSIKTPLWPSEPLISPLRNSIANLSGVNHVLSAGSPKNDYSNADVSALYKTPEVSTGRVISHPTPKSIAKQQSKLEVGIDDSDDVRYMFPTPPKMLNSVTSRTYKSAQRSSRKSDKSPQIKSPKTQSPHKQPKSTQNDITNVSGISTLLRTPRAPPKSPTNDLTKVRGVKQLLKTPRGKAKSPFNDLTKVSGVKKLLKTPRAVRSPKNDLSNLQGVKRLLKTPGKQQKSPHNDLTNVGGVKALLKSPRQAKSPQNDLTNVSGVRALLKTPRGSPKSPKNDLTNVQGVKQLFKSPDKRQKSPRNDLTNIVSLNQLFKSPWRKPNSPRNDLSDLQGVRNLLKTPGRSNRSPRNDLSNISSIKYLLKTPKVAQTSSDAKSNSPRSPKKSSPVNISVAKLTSNSLFDTLLDKPAIRTYERKSGSASKSTTILSSFQENLTYHNRITLSMSGKRKSNEAGSSSAKKQKVNPSPTSKGTPKLRNELGNLFIDMQLDMSVGSRSRAANGNRSDAKRNTSKSVKPKMLSSTIEQLTDSIKEKDNSLPIKKRILLRTNNILGHSTPLRNEISIDKKGLELSPITFDSVVNEQKSPATVINKRKRGKSSKTQPISTQGEPTQSTNLSQTIEELPRKRTRGRNAKTKDMQGKNTKDTTTLKKVTFAEEVTKVITEQTVQKRKGRGKSTAKQNTVTSKNSQSPVKPSDGRKSRSAQSKPLGKGVKTASTKSRRAAAVSPIPVVTSGKRSKAETKIASPKSPKQLRKLRVAKDILPEPIPNLELESSVKATARSRSTKNSLEKRTTRAGGPKPLSSPKLLLTKDKAKSGSALKTSPPDKLASRSRTKVSSITKSPLTKNVKSPSPKKSTSRSRAAKVASPKLLIGMKGKLNNKTTPKKLSSRKVAVAKPSPKGKSKTIPEQKSPSPVKPASRSKPKEIASPKAVSPRKSRSKEAASLVKKSNPKGRSNAAVSDKLPSPVKPMARGRSKKILSPKAMSPRKSRSKVVSSRKKSITVKLPSPVKAASREKLKSPTPKITSPKKSTRGKGKTVKSPPDVQSPKTSKALKSGNKRTKSGTSTTGAKKARCEPPPSKVPKESPAKEPVAKQGKGVNKKTKASTKPAKDVSLKKSPVAAKSTRSTRRRN